MNKKWAYKIPQAFMHCLLSTALFLLPSQADMSSSNLQTRLAVEQGIISGTIALAYEMWGKGYGFDVSWQPALYAAGASAGSQLLLDAVMPGTSGLSNRTLLQPAVGGALFYGSNAFLPQAPLSGQAPLQTFAEGSGYTFAGMAYGYTLLDNYLPSGIKNGSGTSSGTGR